MRYPSLCKVSPDPALTQGKAVGSRMLHQTESIRIMPGRNQLRPPGLPIRSSQSAAAEHISALPDSSAAPTWHVHTTTTCCAFRSWALPLKQTASP